MNRKIAVPGMRPRVAQARAAIPLIINKSSLQDILHA